MRSNWTRRDLLRAALAAVPAAGFLSHYKALAAPHQGKVKITAVKAMALKNIAGNCLIRVDTDAGITGYGEAGSSGPMARARIEIMKPLLVGKDPLLIEVHFHQMTTLMHTYMAHIPTISGIDMALWDLAGKMLGQPVSALLGGPFRDSIPMYSHGIGVDMLDPASCRDWAQRIKQMPEGFTAFKNNIDPVLGVPSARFTDYARQRAAAQRRRALTPMRGKRWERRSTSPSTATTSSIRRARSAVARAVEPMNPLFLEDPLNVPFSEAWMALKRSTRVPILTGEKLEMVRGFRPFLDNQAVDIVHPDLAFAGGITGTTQDRRFRRADPHAGGAAQCRLAGPDFRQRALRLFDPEFLPVGKRAGPA